MAVGGARHGLAAPRGEAPLPGSGGGRFGRMFPALPRRDAGAAATEALAAALVAAIDSRDNPSIPAGYTYLGQFIDHDVTFDPVSQLQRDNDPSALVDFRTPRFDLDSLYGSGPADQPYLYDWSGPRALRGVRLLVGSSPTSNGGPPIADLPRNVQQRALVGDGRNDENLIVAQLHLLFLQFHNRVVDDLRAHRRGLGGPELLEEARRRVRWHYQWIVIHDYLPKVAGDAMAGVERRHFTWRDEPFMPVEFSGAAFRFAHSMVRERYQAKIGGITVPILRPDRRSGRHLGGFRPLPPALEIDWERFFVLPGRPAPQVSMGLNERLASPLRRLPPDGMSLARLNLQRGRALSLPAGADVARAMGEEPLTAEELKLHEHVPDRRLRQALLEATPLWYYLLREAGARGAGGQHLGPVGARIVAEVLTGLLDGDPHSYRRQSPRWRPELPGTDGDFTMADLVAFTHPDPEGPR
jgi:hypothetical protein